MGKAEMTLDFVEMHAIKHALQNVIRQKNKKFGELLAAVNYGEAEILEMDRLKKDIEKENRLIGKVEVRIEEFREKNRIPKKEIE